MRKKHSQNWEIEQEKKKYMKYIVKGKNEENGGKQRKEKGKKRENEEIMIMRTKHSHH